MKKKILLFVVLSILAGCSGHQTSMQDVRSYCRSMNTEELCDSQDSICAKYSEATLRPYKSAKECRQSCEQIRMDSNMQSAMQSCFKIYEAVEGRCNEFCDDNYE